jgi:hypothetical protein
MIITLFLFLILLMVATFIVLTTKEPPELTEVKRRYAILIKNCPEEFKILRKPIIITAFRKRFGEIGYNVNKGCEIGLCIDGTPNQIFHVLIHELAHSTVEVYSHDYEFWKNFEKLKQLCIDLDIYETIPDKTPFCGKTVHD